MITSRTPLRISFLGGGTDYPQWYLEHGGCVLATTINKYCYVMLNNGKEWHSYDLPTKSGLGSSSAYTVGLLRACTEFDQKTIARLATVWESDKLGGNIGSQDQYVCSLGGFRFINFMEQDIKDCIIDPGELIKYLMLFNTHQYRQAGHLVESQIKEMKRHKKSYYWIMDLAKFGLEALENKQYKEFGDLLNQAWGYKKQLSKHISNPTIDNIHESAIKAGAVGGKLLGAGGGGFILFLVEPDKQESVKKALSNLDYVPFKFENEGTQIIYRD